jgi:predicted N-acetyltransferase YhbS
MSRLKIRAFSAADLAGVRNVLVASYGNKAIPEEVFRWWTFDCPVGQPVFMVAEADGRIVGLQPMRIQTFTDGTDSFKGGVLTHVAVHPDYRGRGIFLALVEKCEIEAWRMGAAFVMTMPNDRSCPGFVKMGYKDPGRRRLMVYPLDPGGVARRFLPRASLGKACSTLGTKLLGMWRKAPQASARQVQIIEEIPDDIEEVLSADVQLIPGVRLLRELPWWRWRYSRAPFRHYTLLGERRNGTKMSALAVMTSALRMGIKVGYLLDSVAADLAAFQEVIAGCIIRSKVAGDSALCAVISSALMATLLEEIGFIAVPYWVPIKNFYTVYRTNPNWALPRSRDMDHISNWHLTLGDWDNL